MSKPIKNLITQAYRRQFGDLSGAVVIDLRGVKANDNNAMRSRLAEHQIRVTVVKNSLAKAALAETDLSGICDLLEGCSAMVYGGESIVNVARELVDIARKLKNLEFKGAIMEGELFGPDQVERLSKYPTREEAQAQIIQVFLGPAGQVIGAATSAGSDIASILDALTDKLEKGETLAKAG